MYQQIYEAFQGLSSGDQSELKRCNLKKLINAPAYFRVLKISGAKDNPQTQRILYLYSGIDVCNDEQSTSVAQALFNAGVKEGQVLQINRSGDNSIDYLKRQLTRCNNIDMHDLGKLSQFWGDHKRRVLLKQFILLDNHPA
ncbi:hypothetical protein GZ77_13470 [Endozoicomonas montiporae]|uniref:Uncharacterized protein n=1 Tax=Endozoicomonas montiporae TaxID=1027273 RepID=A0A081N4M3_9GAMM|nr:hypothetical protein GZ77_13470 [Endozoicomonas montiporae]